jgi:hypothetical protein
MHLLSNLDPSLTNMVDTSSIEGSRLRSWELDMVDMEEERC